MKVIRFGLKLIINFVNGITMTKIPIDIMLRGRFIATLRMPLRPWLFTEDEVREFVLSKLPTLRGEDFKIEF